jgi:hypothetical protein
MQHQDSHLSDEQLLLYLEGELPKRGAKPAQEHIESCWRCRTRRQELERAIEDFIHVHQDALDAKLPPGDGPRALLRAQMAQIASADANRRGLPSWVSSRLFRVAAASLGGVLLVALTIPGGIPWRRAARSRPAVSVPDARLTPGAAVLLSRQAVCSLENVKNKAVPVTLQRQVFEEYGIAKAEPRAYEVDYLVTPALGGAEDIRNLWPQSYSSIWNALVKDALEDRLRELVCSGDLELSQAQREIADNWVGAYKKYFHTDRPLEEHLKANPGGE